MTAKNIFDEYEKQFHSFWPQFMPKDESWAKHCLDLNKSIDDLPNDDPYIKKYYGSGLIY